MTTVDPITLEIVRHGLIAAADEMKINLMRTAYNTIIYEVLDFSVGLFDRNGDIISQASGLPIFLGNLGEAVKVVSRDVGLENFDPGDIYLINDTYTSGTHLNDMTVISPVFVNDGEELVGFTGSRAHWLDMGGRDPGGWLTDTTEIYQEGLRLRSVQLSRRRPDTRRPARPSHRRSWRRPSGIRSPPAPDGRRPHGTRPDGV